MNLVSASYFALIAALGTSLAAGCATGSRVVATPSGSVDYRDVDKGQEFISPLRLQLVMANDDPRRPQLCTQLGRFGRCPQILTNGAGGIPMIEPALTANLPNVRVSFVILSITHEAIAEGGVLGDEVAGDFVTWETTNPAADVEDGGPVGWGLPPAGETWNDYSLTIYDALVMDACGSFSSFPVTHVATANNNAVEVGEFQGTDNTTLDSTGFYNLSYTIEAQDGDAVSHFHFSGKVNVTCSGANSL